ncbi:MAG: L-serine ammonia-lyase, iron-sulfur-dependent, subunit alpha [Gemmatimonadota bacterium]
MTARKVEMPVLRDGAPPRYPSIFNDVIGPVMRGPSSSHCAAAVRIGRLARDLMGSEIGEVLVEFHPNGSLATTHESQGSDMGLFGGLLGWDATDERLVDSAEAIREAGIEVEIRITDFPAFHPNTYRITLRNGGAEHRMTALSTGGGIIQVVEIDGVALSIAGDFHETLLFVRGDGGEPHDRENIPSKLLEKLEGGDTSGVEADQILLHSPGEGPENGSASVAIVQIKAQSFPPNESLRELCRGFAISEIRTLSPVLPIRSRKGMELPFLTAEGLLVHKRLQDQQVGRDLDLWELAVHYESARGGISHEEVLERMADIVGIIERSIEEGLAGTEFGDRILKAQTGLFKAHIEGGKLLDAGVLNRIILYVSAIMEVKSSMGVIVAAPTAGSCGALPGSVVGVGHALGLSTEEMARAMLAAGIIGVFITAGSTFAAEVCGCQAECGSGSGMAAAALVTLAGGSTEQALGAASMALQNTLGMICDPVANRVEVPCLGRNVLAASNALASANMALAGFDAVIPLDEVIQAMDEVGKSLPHELRCTALGGLSVTETSKRIQENLDHRSRRG